MPTANVNELGLMAPLLPAAVPTDAAVVVYTPSSKQKIAIVDVADMLAASIAVGGSVGSIARPTAVAADLATVSLDPGTGTAILTASAAHSVTHLKVGTVQPGDGATMDLIFGGNYPVTLSAAKTDSDATTGEFSFAADYTQYTFWPGDRARLTYLKGLGDSDSKWAVEPRPTPVLLAPAVSASPSAGVPVTVTPTPLGKPTGTAGAALTWATVIDWGDGSREAVDDPTAATPHTYGGAGTYPVTILSSLGTSPPRTASAVLLVTVDAMRLDFSGAAPSEFLYLLEEGLWL